MLSLRLIGKTYCLPNSSSLLTLYGLPHGWVVWYIVSLIGHHCWPFMGYPHGWVVWYIVSLIGHHCWPSMGYPHGWVVWYIVSLIGHHCWPFMGYPHSWVVWCIVSLIGHHYWPFMGYPHGWVVWYISVQLKSSPGCESHPDIWAGEPQPKTARPGDELLFLHPYQFPGLLYWKKYLSCFWRRCSPLLKGSPIRTWQVA